MENISNYTVNPKYNETINKRKSQFKKKLRSPNFKDVLRQKCKDRIRTSRNAMINSFRKIDENGDESGDTDVLVSMLKKDIIDILPTIPEDDIYMEDSTTNNENEDLKDDEKWLYEQYELLLEQNEFLLEIWENQVICPLCLKSAVTEQFNLIDCKHCKVILAVNCSLLNFKTLLNNAVLSHSERCQRESKFLLIDKCGLFIECDGCDFIFVC